MKVLLDSANVAPQGWRLARWPHDAISLLKTGAVTELIINTDKGKQKRGSGEDVLEWLNEAIVDIGLSPPNIKVHANNIDQHKRMMSKVHRIYLTHRMKFIR